MSNHSRAKCKNGAHDLVVVLKAQSRMPWDESQSVARWCRYCGAVVVDVDFDGRTNPGAIKSMQFPLVLQDSKL